MTLELTAYCDESGTQAHDLIVAGYVAPAVEWLQVEKIWSQVLERAGLHEFKMADCHHGQGEFKGRENRIELRDTFLSVMDSANVDGFAIRIDLVTFDEVRTKLKSSIRPGFNEPYLHGFSALTQFMADLVADKPRDERIRFVFDENDQFRGRALEMFKEMKVNPSVAYRHRLGSITFENSQRHAALQAADTLAYRVHHDLLRSLPEQRSRVRRTAPRIRVAFLGSDAVG